LALGWLFSLYNESDASIRCLPKAGRSEAIKLAALRAALRRQHDYLSPPGALWQAPEKCLLGETHCTEKKAVTMPQPWSFSAWDRQAIGSNRLRWGRGSIYYRELSRCGENPTTAVELRAVCRFKKIGLSLGTGGRSIW
jgi:hypothetical protein